MAPQKYTEARREGNRKWDAANLDRISVAAAKGTKDRWKDAAAVRGKSLNQFIVDTVEKEVTNDADGKGSADDSESDGL